MTNVETTNEQEIDITLNPNSGSKPAKFDGAPTWTVTSGDSVVTPTPDGLNAVLTSSDTPGETRILLEGDADLGEGVEKLSEEIVYTVTGARATNFGISIGVARPKPAAV